MFNLVDFTGNLVPVSKENEKLCLCPKCPTYQKSGLTGILFCGEGKAAEKIEIAGCICPSCEVFKKYQLDQMYYCDQGKSADLHTQPPLG